MGAQRCRECGAELEPGPTLCPLCGTHASDPPRPRRRPVADVESYQVELRALRDRLKRLRDEGAEAV